MNEQEKINLLTRASDFMYGTGRLEFKRFNTAKTYSDFIKLCDQENLNSHEWVKEGIYVLEHYEPDQINNIYYLDNALKIYIDISLEEYSFSNSKYDIALLIDLLRFKGYEADYQLLGALPYELYETIKNRFTDEHDNKDWLYIHRQILRTIGYIDGYNYRYVIVDGIYGTLTTIHAADSVKFYGVIYSEKVDNVVNALS